jgi:TonB-linked SusC/RagA family outer membrane protein
MNKKLLRYTAASLLLAAVFPTQAQNAKQKGSNHSEELNPSIQLVNNKQNRSDSIGPKQQKSFLFQDIPTAFGPTINRSQSTSSSTTVMGSTLKRFNTPTLANTMMGHLPGLHISQTGSAPGNNDAPNFLLRGRQTYQDNNILILVDGFETNYNTLMPDEIESVTVLKDAAALALYGMDAANGVVLITTKKGVAGNKNKITFSARVGVQQAAVLPKFLNNGDYAELFNQGMIADNKLIESGYFRTPAIVDYFKNGTYPQLYPDVDWYNATLRDAVLSHDYSMTFSGGKEDAKFFVALGYANYDGLYQNNSKRRTLNTNYNFERFNLRANFDVNINKFLSSEIRFRGTMLNKYFPPIAENTIWRNMALFNPYPITTDDGSWGGTQGYSDNVVASINQRGYQSINDRTVDANVKLIAKLDMITPGLKAFGQLVFSNFYFSTYNKVRGYAYQELIPRFDQQIPGSSELPFDRITRGSTDQNFSITQGTGSQYNRTNVLAGLEYGRKIGTGELYASTQYFQESFKTDGDVIPFAKQQIMGRIGYQLKKTYSAEFAYAYGGSENFPKGNRFGFFPTFSAGWTLSNESFFKNKDLFQHLRIRGSVGLLGNDRAGNTGRFIFNQFYVGAGNYPTGNVLGINNGTFREGNLANPLATWEKALRANLGLDAVLAKDFSIAIDVFRENRSDIFINPTNYIPAIVGANFFNLNRGKTQSSGIELELQWQKQLGSLSLYSRVNAAYNRNKIIDIAEPLREDEYLYARGRAINQPFVLEAIGFFESQNEIDNSPQQLFGKVQPGDIKYKDQNGDGFIDDNDRIPVGNTNYPALVYGWETGANLKGFDLNIFLQGAAARTVSLLDNNNIVPFLNGGVKPSDWVKNNHWTPERGNNAKFPRLTTESNDNNYRASTLWQRNGSFLRVRVVEIGYTLPSSALKRFKMSGARLFISGNNLFTLHGINEMSVDPEVMNQFVHPPLKSYNFGINLTL